MKIKDLNIRLMVNHQIKLSGMANVDNNSHVMRCTAVMNKLRNRKANRVSLTDAYKVVDKMFDDPEQNGVHKYSLLLLFDNIRKYRSYPCLGVEVTCPNCGGKGHLAERSKVDSRAPAGVKIYVCDNYDNGCQSYVSTHAGDHLPMGTMATKETRTLRVKVHSAIDKLWQSGRVNRRELYNRLGSYIGMKDFHIAKLNAYQCQQVLSHSNYFG